MLLACDIGNTNIVIGVWKDQNLVARFRVHTRVDATSDEYIATISNLLSAIQLPLEKFDGCVLSSVVPPLTSELVSALKKISQVDVFVISPGIKTGLNILYDDPREVGADRIVNSVAAISIEKPPLIVVDFGTATTFDLITPPANYVGGAIAPGLFISMEALINRTAKLPKVEMFIPASAIGDNTEDAIRSGVILGHSVMADGIIERIEKERNIQTRVIATGGFAELIKSTSKRIDRVEPNLTLLGLKILWEKNKITKL